MNMLRDLQVVVLLGCTIAGFGQQLPMRQGATEMTLWAGAGSGLGHSDSTQMAVAGFRFGKVLTGEHGPSWLRGNFEYAFDLMPLYMFFQGQQSTGLPESVYAAISTEPPGAGEQQLTGHRQAVYGGSFNPIVLKWNFTRGKRMVPFAAIEGGVICTAHNVPAGNTSPVNFGSGVAYGMQFLRGEHHAISISGHVLHISNASLGTLNPSINISAHLRVGYEWWK